MPLHQIPIEELEIDGNLMFTSRAVLHVHQIAGRAGAESWSIEARIKGRADAAVNVSIKARTAAAHTYSGRGIASEHVNLGEPTSLDIRGVGPLDGFDGSVDVD